MITYTAGGDVQIIPANGSVETINLTNGLEWDQFSTFSPDGIHVARGGLTLVIQRLVDCAYSLQKPPNTGSSRPPSLRCAQMLRDRRGDTVAFCWNSSYNEFVALPCQAAGEPSRWGGCLIIAARKKAMSKRTSFLLIGLVFMFSGCQSAKNNGFAINLLANKEVAASELAKMDINQLDIETKPLISIEDVISYDKITHTIELTQEAISRIQQIPEEVAGIPFVVCVGKERIYTGAFWTPISSLSYDGVVIMQSIYVTETTIQITLGYPGQGFFTGNDPRIDSRIMDSLAQSQKLK